MDNDDKPIVTSSNDPLTDSTILQDCIGLELSESDIKKITTSKRRCLSLRQIALLYIYQDKVISLQEAKKIATFFNYTAGGRLKKLHNSLSQPTNRTGVEGREVNPLIDDIEKVLPYLNGNQLLLTQKELTTIKEKL